MSTTIKQIPSKNLYKFTWPHYQPNKKKKKIEEVKFLREDSIKKSTIIINLIDIAHKDKNNDDHMTSKQMKANIDNVCTEHDRSSEQCFNTPVIAKTLPTCEHANRRETNDVRRHNIEKLLTLLNSTPLMKDESNNPSVR